MVKIDFTNYQTELIKNHIFIEKTKLFSGLGIVIISIILVILNNPLVLGIEFNVLGYIAAGGAFISSSSKIKNMKELLSLG